MMIALLGLIKKRHGEGKLSARIEQGLMAKDARIESLLMESGLRISDERIRAFVWPVKG
jgi:hypothetical protein